jgi:hypothetical protein
VVDVSAHRTSVIQSVEEYLKLVELDDDESGHRLKWDVAPPAVWEEVIRSHPQLKRTVTLNKMLDNATLALLAKDGDDRVRLDVAGKRKLSRELFEKLAADPDDSVRARIAGNRKAPEEIVQRLATDPSRLVREAAFRRSGS